MGRRLSRVERELTKNGDVYLDFDLVKSAAVQLGPVNFREGAAGVSGRMERVVMHRKGAGAFAVPRFGVFEGTLTHTGPDDEQRMFLQVKWYKASPVMYSRNMKAPMALATIDTQIPNLCLAEDIVPFLCYSAPHLEHDSHLVILAKDWSCLPLLGFPQML